MRASGVAMQAFLASRAPFWRADLFTFTLSNGTVYRWTTSDQPIAAAGVLWSSVGPVLKLSGWSIKNTMEIPQMTLMIYSNGQDVGSINLKLAIHNGLLDNATVVLQRAIMPTFGDTSLGLVQIFRSKVSSVTVNDLGATITLKGANNFLQQYIPRNTYQTGCIWALYGQGCLADRPSHQETHTITAVDSQRLTIAFADAGTNPAFFVNGVANITTGAAAGSIRTITSASVGHVGLAYPLYAAPAVGDTVVLTQGCAKTRTACDTQFANLAHYRGFPYVPPAETAT